MTFFKTALFCAILMIAGPAFSQTSINLGAINADSTAPLEITSETLNVDQETGIAVFEGDVVAGQGDLRLTANYVEVFYDSATSEIIRLFARDDVTLATPTDAAEADTAEYDLEAGTLLMSGDVLLTQGNSAISSDSMRVNLTDGSAQMEGRVRTILNQGGN
ncbi:MAG: lipopolysaccharide transport periplasmic protein LptA [Octadecabacter sp.]|nr:lipopolysaccharide transport periplasmic protein LptA [Octadecabacter sp.]